MVIYRRRWFCINNIQTSSSNWKKKARQCKATSTYLEIIRFTFRIINQQTFFLPVKILLLKYIENHNVTKNCGMQKEWDTVNFMLPWKERLIAREGYKSIYCTVNTTNRIAKMEVGCLEYPGASTSTTAQPSREPPHERKGTGTCHTENLWEEKPTKPRERGEGEKRLTEPSTMENWTRQWITWSM